jgi:hypothetical protein
LCVVCPIISFSILVSWGVLWPLLPKVELTAKGGPPTKNGTLNEHHLF